MGLRNKGTAQNVTNIKYVLLLQVDYKYLYSTTNRYRPLRKYHISSQGRILHRSEGFGFFCCVDFMISLVLSNSP